MALSGWDANKKFDIIIPAQSEVLTDLPIQINLTEACSTSGIDASAIFTELGSNWSKLAIEYNNTGTECYCEVERWDAVNKSAQLWVKATALTTETELSLYYDSTHVGSSHVDDPHWSSVVLAMPMDGADGSTVFTDLKSHAVTTNGNTLLKNTQSKFGGTSAYFDGTGDYLSIPSSTDFDFGTGDFCIEFWTNAGVLASYSCFISRQIDVAPGLALQVRVDGSRNFQVVLCESATVQTITGSAGPQLNQWAHLAVSRQSGTVCLFVNGAQVASAANSMSLSAVTTNLYVGGSYLSGFTYPINGYIDDLRITKGIARYYSNFTPPARSVFGTVGAIGQHQAQNVWSNNFAAVYHLSQDPSITVKDSTFNARHLAPSGSMTVAGNIIDGPVGKALSLDGIDDWLSTAASNFSALQTAYTLESVTKWTSTASPWSEIGRFGAVTNGNPILGEYTTLNYLNTGVVGDDIQSGISTLPSEFKHYGSVFSSGALRSVGNGSIDSVTNSVSISNLSSVPFSIGSYSGRDVYEGNTARSVRISSVARSAAWLSSSYLSDFDLLISIANSITRGPRGEISCVYDLNFLLAAVIEQTYGLKLGALFSQPYGDVGTIRQGSTQWYGDASLIRSAMVAVYGPAIRTSALLNHIYSLPDRLLVAAWQSYGIAGAAPRGVLAQAFDLTSTDLVRNFAANPYAILGDNGQVLAYTTSVTAGGVAIDPSGISISGSLNEYCLSCDLELATQTDYLACAIGVDMDVTINAETYRFFVEGRGRSREHGSTGYTVHGLSRTALLDAPYAEPVSVELTGMASTIAASLAPEYALQWDTVDWLIPANTMLPADKTPLEVIRELAHAAGAILQTAPDGTLIVQANYIQAVPSWGTATPDYLLSDSLDFFTDSAEYEHRDGYNKFLISDQLTTNDTVRMEEETITDTTKIIRGYKTPWEETFTLRHTGGDWVTIEPLGVETIDKIEVIEFVAGTGRTQYPIYGITDMAWLQNNLGVVTHSEDGSLESSVPEESLLSITYQTKCLKWKAINPQSEKVQFVAEEPAI